MSRMGGWLPTLGLTLALAAKPAMAQIATDGSANADLHGLVPFDGSNYDIRAEFGRRAGDNLFHSFERFSLRDGKTATFRGPDAIRNVISRVTGGERSRINGKIASMMPNADFFLLNPAGVVFGPSAVLDVQGSFHVSTADELRFANGKVFSARLDEASSFSVAAPEAFGFLGADPKPIGVNASLLQVLPREVLSIVGGDVDITGGPEGFIRAEAGRITLAAVSGPGEARLGDGTVVADRRADITLRDHSRLRTTGDGGGTIRIMGGAIVVEDGTTVFADNTGPSDSRGGIDVDGGRLEMRDRAQLTADVVGPDATGRGGGVSVRADRVELAAGSRLSASSFAAGEAGIVTVEAGQLRVSREGSDQVTGIVSDAETSSTETGDAGTVNVTARDIEIRDGGEIRSSTFGAGDSGVVEVQATRLQISGEGLEGLEPLTGISSQVQEGSSGDGGRLTVTAENIELRADGKIRSVIFGQGNAGTVTITADHVRLLGGGQISSSTFGTGESGDVVLTVHETLSMSGQSRFFDEDNRVFPPSGVFASTNSRKPSSGAGGTVTVTAPVIRLADRGEIASESFGGGAGGDVLVTTESLVIEDAEITTRAESSGAAGAITVSAGLVELRHRGLISSQALSDGDAGSVDVQADRLLSDHGEISTESAAAGGGSIGLRVEDAIVLRDREVTTSVQGGTEPTAGNILIDPKVLVIDGSTIEADARTGVGGNIRISADNILVPEGDLEGLIARGDISASGATEEVNGTVSINAPEVDLSGGLVVLQGALLDAASQLRERCGARRDIGASSFTGVGRGGLPPSPDGPLAGAYAGGAGAPGVALPEERGEEVSAEKHSGERAVWPAVAGLAPCRGAL